MSTPEADWDALYDLPLREWRPRSKMVATVTAVDRPAFPAIDIHNHIGRWLSHDGDWLIRDPGALVAMMDEVDVRTIVNLDGRWGEEVTANVERYDRAYPGRFITFCHVEWERLAEPEGEQTLIAQLEDSAARGARGIKVWKNLGLWVEDADGSKILPDDPRVIRILTRAGELGLPILIHVSDPKAFFDPLDVYNERLDELMHSRDWWFGDTTKFPTFERIVAGLANLVLATPGTTYVGAHVGCVAEDLDWVEGLLAKAPNFNVDIAGRMAEIGRQPRRLAKMVERFPDRVLFGTDIYPISAEAYRNHFRFLETQDESFDYSPGEEIPPQGRWTVSGADLPAHLLKAIYHDNAHRILT